MKLLLDENLSYRLVKVLSPIYPGSLHASSVRPILRTDMGIWTYARNNGFIIVTFDSDFLQLATLHGMPPKVILLTIQNPRRAAIASLLSMRQEQIHHFVERTEHDDPAVLELGG